LIPLKKGAIAMCHGYEMKWWKSESAAKQHIKEASQADEKAKVVSEPKVEEKELIPAE
jgi:hypothetical protein